MYFLLYLLPTLWGFSKMLTLDFLLTLFHQMFPASDIVQSISYEATGNIQGPEKRRNYFNSFSLCLELVTGPILSWNPPFIFLCCSSSFRFVNCPFLLCAHVCWLSYLWTSPSGVSPSLWVAGRSLLFLLAVLYILRNSRERWFSHNI